MAALTQAIGAVRVSDELKARLERIARLEDRPMGWVIRKALEEAADRYEEAPEGFS